VGAKPNGPGRNEEQARRQRTVQIPSEAVSYAMRVGVDVDSDRDRDLLHQRCRLQLFFPTIKMR
jgi:hypothetical protein